MPGDREPTEWLDLGPRVRPRRSVAVLAAAFTVIIGVVTVLAVGSPDRGSTSPSVTDASTPVSGPPTGSTASAAPAASRVTRDRADVGALAGSAGYEIVGYTGTAVVRLRPSDGRVVTTTLPVAARERGAASIVTGPGFVLAVTADVDGGFLVRDDRPARTGRGETGSAAFAFPGPEPGTVWAVSPPQGNTHGLSPVQVQLVGPAGGTVGRSLIVPFGATGYRMSGDDAGQLVVRGRDGVYLTGSGRPRLITNGSLLAVGPSRFVLAECDGPDDCRIQSVDRTTGVRTVVTGPVPAGVTRPGRVSPDGRYAAMITEAPGSAPGVTVVDLTRGEPRPVAGVDAIAGPAPTLVWTPDSRWLLAVGADGRLQLIDPRVGTGTRVAASLPPLLALAVRVDAAAD